jgi:DNA-binding response OmpR family regulator
MNNIAVLSDRLIEIAHELSQMSGGATVISHSPTVEDVQSTFAFARRGPAQLISILLRQQGRPVSDEDLTQEMGCGANSLTVFASNARMVLAHAGHPRAIRRVRRDGYYISRADARKIIPICTI